MMSGNILPASYYFVKGVLYIGYYKAWFVATEQESPIEVIQSLVLLKIIMKINRGGLQVKLLLSEDLLNF